MCKIEITTINYLEQLIEMAALIPDVEEFSDRGGV